jgi:hypothetical protein
MKDQSLLAVAQRAYQVAQRAMPAFRSKFSKKIFTQPQLLAALILRAYLRQTYREAEAWWVATDRVRGLLQIRQPPDHSTLCWFFHHKVNERLLARLLALCLPPYDPRHNRRRVVALDSTGFEAGHCSRYYRWRCGRRGQHGWPKWIIAVWLPTQLICAQRAHGGPAGDFGELPPVAASARRTLPFGRLLADAGFDSEANHRFCHERLGVESIIGQFARHGCAPRTLWRKRLARNFPRRVYRQRWLAETVISVVKRKLGDAVHARSARRQYRELLLLGVVYNVHRRTFVLIAAVQIHSSTRISTEQHRLS